VKFFVRDTNITILSTGEFPENGAVRTIGFWVQIQLILFVYRETLRHFESKARLGKVYVLRHSIYRSQPSYRVNFLFRKPNFLRYFYGFTTFPETK